ncbi:Protein sof1 [Malassezia yamatoensis]|uniref:DDB1- and CUL4-associated factor 13 n=1 Tax=Malassezia yamatoensis TaxID=253288 RepID=A0AAJ5YTT9_9BASI|nr:Protein sof1 [Malassezia yamatoensis]
MKIKALTRSLDDHAPARLGDATPVQRNLDPNMHPFEKPREYTRALNAAKLDRLFAKPFVAALEGHVDGIYSMCRDPKRLDRMASGSGDGEIRLWDLNHQRCLYTFHRAHAGIISALTTSPVMFNGGGSAHDAPAGRRMLSCSVDRTIKVWNADPVSDSFGQYAEYTHEDSEDSDEEISGTRDPNLFSIQPRSVAPSEPLTVYNGKTAFNSLSTHAHQPRFASASDTVQIWDLNRGGGSSALSTMAMGPDPVHVVRFNPSETEILASAGADRGITLYDLRSGKPLTKSVLKMRANDLAWSPLEPTTLAVASEDHNLYTFDMRNMSSATQIYKGHVGAVMSVDWAPTGQELVTGSYDRTVRLWDSGQGARSRDVYHTKRMQRVFSVSFSLDARFVMSGSDDGNLRIWKAHASDKLGIVSSRERASRDYAQALRKRWNTVGDVAKIERQRHVPKPIRSAQKLQHTMNEAARVKEDKRRRHTKLSNIPYVRGDFAIAWKVQHAVSSTSRKGGSALSQLMNEADDRSRLTPKPSNESLGTVFGDPSSGSVNHAITSEPEEVQENHLFPSSNQASDTEIPTQDPNFTPRVRGSHNNDVDTASTDRNQFKQSSESLTDAGLHQDVKKPQHGSPWHRMKHLRDKSDSRRLRPRANSWTHRNGSANAHHSSLESKGVTQSQSVEERSVRFERKFDVVVRIPIQKPSMPAIDPERADSESIPSPRSGTESATVGFLGETLVELKVQQDIPTVTGLSTHTHGEHDILGTVALNLAEYAPKSIAGASLSSASSSYSGSTNQGIRSETRQYLLDDCLANVLLRLSVEMRYIGTTPEPYRVPPIRGGILDLASVMAPEPKDLASMGDATALDNDRSNNKQQRMEWLGERPGLESHFKMPMSVHYRITAVKSDYLRNSSDDVLHCVSQPCDKLLAKDASKPRIVYCDTDTDRLIDELFEGQFGPTLDEREPPSSQSSASSVHRSNVAKKRWEKLFHNLGHAAQLADSKRTQRQASGKSETLSSSTHESSSQPSSGPRSPILCDNLRTPRFLEHFRPNRVPNENSHAT